MGRIRLNPQPHAAVHKIVKIRDPWHADAFEGTPAEGVVGHTGPRRDVWAIEDAWGNVVGTFVSVPEGTVAGEWDEAEAAWFWITREIVREPPEVSER